jgi:hypothetical protein
MKPDLRISIKDHNRKKNLKVLLFRTPFPSRAFLVRMNGPPSLAAMEGGSTLASAWWARLVDATGNDLAQVAGEVRA